MIFLKSQVKINNLKNVYEEDILKQVETKLMSKS